MQQPSTLASGAQSAAMGGTLAPLACMPSTSGRVTSRPQRALVVVAADANNRSPVSTSAVTLGVRGRTASTGFDSAALNLGGIMTAPSSRPAAQPASPAQQPAKQQQERAAGRVVLESKDELRSTWVHRAWVGGAHYLLAALAYQGVAAVDGSADALALGAAALAAYVLSDLGTGIYHWSVDNYGGASTPVVGGQIAAFQGHHQRPWTITEREFCNNVHLVFKPAVPAAAALLAASPWLPGWADFGLATFVWLVCMSQQFHAWSHMKKSDLPAAVDALQQAGVLISRKAHGAHHKAPFEGNYCIVSGLWNEALDKEGAEDGFFRQLERVVYSATGVEPRCWTEPNYEWVDHYFEDGKQWDDASAE